MEEKMSSGKECEMSQAEISERRNSDIPLGSLGREALRREQ
jgi:hypothetical protein